MLTFLWYLLMTVEVLLALLLVLVILLQRSREDGLGLAFGSAMGESLFGTQASTILTKATVVMTILFLLNTIALGRVGSLRWSRRALIGDRIPESPSSAVDLQTIPTLPAAESDIEDQPRPSTPASEEMPLAADQTPMTVPLALPTAPVPVPPTEAREPAPEEAPAPSALPVAPDS